MKDNNKMGEKVTFPLNNGVPDDQNEDDMEQDINEEEEEEEDDDGEFEDMTPEEFNALDSKMDELNSALDNIEQKNDVIYSELQKLLQANREIREQMTNHSATGNSTKAAQQ